MAEVEGWINVAHGTVGEPVSGAYGTVWSSKEEAEAAHPAILKHKGNCEHRADVEAVRIVMHHPRATTYERAAFIQEVRKALNDRAEKT